MLKTWGGTHSIFVSIPLITVSDGLNFEFLIFIYGLVQDETVQVSHNCYEVNYFSGGTVFLKRVFFLWYLLHPYNFVHEFHVIYFRAY